MGYCNKFCSQYGDALFVIFRVLVGLMFFLHGYDKIFAKGMPVASLMGVAGVVELLVGLGVLLGLFTRLLALLGGIQMLIAYFKVHFSGGLSPLVNGGELSLLYLAAFLVLMHYGAGKWSLEKQLLKKETF